MKRPSQRQKYRLARAALFIIASRPHDAEIRAKSHAEAWYHDFVYTRQIAKRALRIIGEIKE